MPATVTLLGPGTLTIGEGTPSDFSCEVMGGKVTHEYEEISEKRTRLCGTVIPAQESRGDGFAFDLENDLSAAGLYAFLQTNDLTEQTVTYTPNTANGAEWAGPCIMKLPAETGADEFGQPIASSVEWTAVGKLTFTAATAAP